MIEWNREVASIIQLSLVALFLVLMLLKRKELGIGIIYFIIATALVLCIDTFLFAIRFSIPRFNSVPLYSVGTNLLVFLLFFLYFRQVLELEKSKRINLITIIIFLTSYGLFAVFSDNFFTTFPFKFYFIEVLLLLGNIYLVLHETFNSDKVLRIKYYFPLWACIGLMSIYLGVTPLMIISNSAMKLMSVNIFFLILLIVNVIGYSILIIGAILAKNINIKK